MRTRSPRFVLYLGILANAVLLPTTSPAQYIDVTSGDLGYAGTSFGAAWGDVDLDGDLDLYFTNGDGPSKLLRNEGGDTFADITTTALGGNGADAGVSFGDCDNDGDLDLFVVNSNWLNRMFRNDNGVLVSVSGGDATIGLGLAQSVAWADYDLDGDLDIFVSYWGVANKLLRNDGNGSFTDSTPAVLADTQKNTGAAWADYDNDLDPDLYVGARISGKLYRNEGSGAFTDVTTSNLAKTGVNGVAWGDYDDDGDLDLYLARDLNSSRLLRNDTAAGVTDFADMFIPVVRDPGSTQGVAWLDYENDGDLDLFLAKAGRDNSQVAANRLIRNNGGGSFTDISEGPVLAAANSRGVAVGDYDGNGTQDLYVANWGSANQLLRNDVDYSKWIQVRLVGSDTNRWGIGAKVRIVAAGKAQIREVSLGSGIYSQNMPIAAFGFHYLTTIVDSVKVFWPSGAVTERNMLAPNQRIVIQETGQVGVGDNGLPPIARLISASPNPFRLNTSLAYELLETSPVDLRIVDVGGRLLRVLESGESKEPGRYEARWDGRTQDGTPAVPGVYFYALTARGLRQTLPVVRLP